MCAFLFGLASPLFGQGTEKTTESPSPDGEFAFLDTSAPEQRTLDLIEKKSEKVLLRLAESEEGRNRLVWKVLWTPDSKRFALRYSVIRQTGEVAVYFRTGDTFREVKLPDVPDTVVPDRLKRGKHLEHEAAINSAGVIGWQPDGSLAVEFVSMVDGAGGSATATRSVLFGFTPAGKAKILKSTIKYKVEKD